MKKWMTLVALCAFFNSFSAIASLSEEKPPVLNISVSTPSTPTSYPGVTGNGYYVVKSSVRTSLAAVSGATSYKLYTSTSKTGNYIEVASGSSRSLSFTSRSSRGNQYIKYKACIGNNCSNFSPYRQIYVYAAPYTPSYLTSSNYAPSKNQGFVLSFSAAGGMVPESEFKLQESINGGSYQTICTKARNGSTSYSCSIGGKNRDGTYKYRVIACNPNNAGCGGYRYIDKNVVVSTPTLSKPSVSFAASGPTKTRVSISASSGASIYYSVNGSTPATLYSSPFYIYSSKTIKAVAKKSGYNDSAIQTKNYYFTPSTPTEPPVVQSSNGYHPVNTSVSLIGKPIQHATKYEFVVSNDNVTYQSLGNSGSYSNNVTTRSDFGYQYIKYRGCNNANTCGGFSPLSTLR